MARPLQSHELDGRMPVTRAAGLLIGLKSEELWEHRKAARSGDVDGVHDMRVSAKRLREMLRIFRPVLPRAGRRCLAEVDALNDALGAVRDRDVLLLRIADLARKHPENAGALEELAAGISAERADHFPALVKSLSDHRAAGGVAGTLDRLARNLLSRPVHHGDTTVGRFAHAAIARRLMPVFADTASARDPANVAGFHALRIRVKRLKYAIEPFLCILPASVTEAYQRVAQLQETMGLVHDDDVLLGIIADFAAGRTPPPYVAAALGHLREARTRGHSDAVASLDQMEADGLARDLMDALD